MPPQHPLIDKTAPSFAIPDSNGEVFKFPPEQEGKHIEKPIALFFYPESGTYGCTREACQFRDALAGVRRFILRNHHAQCLLTFHKSEKEIYKRYDVLVVGVSSDPVEKQKAFVEKHKLPYPVLSDTDQAAHKAYQIGRGMLGLTDARTTFVIDRKGIVKGILSATMNFSAHVKFVTKELEKMQDDVTEAGSDRENATPPVDSSESAERDELGRVAQAVGA